MSRTLSFAACASLFALAASCGGADDDAARVITPGAEPSENAATQTAPEPDTAKPQTAFVAGEDPARPAMTGKQIFDAQCSYCHAAGEEHPGTFQLGTTRGADYAVLEAREDLTSDYVKYIVRNGLNGMPTFKPTVITDAELDALARYLGKAD